MKAKYLRKASPKSDKKINAIAAAAGKLFSTKGYIETSMEHVASASKISKGGMYHYFSSKDDLLYLVTSGFMNLVLESVEQELERIESPVEKIRFIIFRHVKTYTDHMYAARTLLNEVHNLSARRLKEIKAKERTYFAVITRALSSYLGPGFDKDTLRIVTFSLLGMCNWIYSWYDPKGRTGPEQLSQIIFEIFTKGSSSFQRK